MFERFTDRARRVVVLAQEHSRMLKHGYIGTEHILLALCDPNLGATISTDVLVKDLKLSPTDLVAQVKEIIGEGTDAPSGHIPFTPRTKKVIELSLREALQLGHNYIGTEHILLALIREGEGVGARVLVKSGADLNVVRQAVIDRLKTPVSVSKSDPAPEGPHHLYVRVRELQALPGGTYAEVPEEYEYLVSNIGTWSTNEYGVLITFKDEQIVRHFYPHVEQIWSD